MESTFQRELAASRKDDVQPGYGFSILVVEDDEDQLLLTVSQLKKQGFEVEGCLDGESALHMLSRHQYHAVVCDFGLPGMNGGQLLIQVRRHHAQTSFVMLTGFKDVDLAVESMRNGADEYLIKPVPPVQLRTKILDAIEYREKAQKLAKKEEWEEIIKNMDSMMRSLEEKDKYTKDHSKKVERVSMAMAREIPFLTETDRRAIKVGARLHDIGKIGVSESILHKEGALNDEEWLEIKKHPEAGAKIARHLPEDIRNIIRFEHERWDGNGYTEGLAGEAIPLGSRLVMIADTYDAVCSDRPYRKALSKDEALNIIRDGSGSQFDPQLVPVFEKVVDSLDHPYD